jgi:2-keto-myo-inositol isomerase
MVSRRIVCFAPLAQVVTRAASAPAKMQLCMHMTTTVSAGFRGSLEGWARAGIKSCEFTSSAVDAFLKTEDVAAARRLIADLGLTPVSCGSVVGLWEPNPKRAATLDSLKQRCEMYSSLGLKQIVCPCNTTQKVTEDDYKLGLDNMREVGEIVKQYPMTVMVEFSRGSTFIGTLSTSLQMTREAAHPNVRPMFDCYHFWAGQSKFEDLDLIRSNEIVHVHFQDVPADLPRELLGQTTRVIPGDGISPLPRILRKLSEKGYAGPLSVELFRPEFQNADPYEMASRIRAKAEPIMREAGVL